MVSPQDERWPHQDPTVSRQYNRWARVYDWIWRRYVDQTLPVLQRAAAVTPDEHVLDLACGTGEWLRRVAETTPEARLTGIDIAPNMVERARSKLQSYPQVSVQGGDAHDLPFADDTFDVVVSASTFHYFTHPHVVLEEVGRVLHPEGRLVLLDWCRDFWACRVLDAVLRWVDPAHHRCYTLDEFTTFIETTSLDVRAGVRYRFDLVWGMMVVEARPSTRDDRRSAGARPL